MNRSCFLNVFVCIIIMTPACSFGDLYTDTGMMTFWQPNCYTFQAHYWGFPYNWECETADGYTIIQSQSDGYWYYAELGANGQYVPSSYKVIIDQPVGILPHLRRSTQRMAEIDAYVAGINLQRDQRRNQFLDDLQRARQAEVPLEYIVGVLCFDYEDSPHREEDMMLHEDMIEMLDSDGTYYTDYQTENLQTMMVNTFLEVCVTIFRRFLMVLWICDLY